MSGASNRGSMLKVKDLAARWGVSGKTIYEAIKDGSFPLPVVRVGSKLILIPLAAVERAEQGRDVQEG